MIGASLAMVPGSSYAEPRTVEDAEELVEELNHEAAVINERVNDLHTKIERIDKSVAKIDADVERQQERVEELRGQIGKYAAAEYRSGGVDTTTQLLAADDPDEFLAQLSSAQVFTDQQASVLKRLKAADKKLAEQKDRQQAELDKRREAKKKAAQEKKAVEAKVDEAEQVLERLTEEERQRMRRAQQQAQREAAESRTSRGGEREPEPSDPPPASGRGGTALAYAQQQLGKPYVFGASGPDAFDCSGLTQAAWAQAGVSLPHSSRSQYAVGAKISRSQLQAGDLVIFYSDMHHVGIYAGNNQVIHAPRPGKPVEYSPIDYMPYAGAVRPG